MCVRSVKLILGKSCRGLQAVEVICRLLGEAAEPGESHLTEVYETGSRLRFWGGIERA